MERKGKADPEVEWEVQEADKEQQDCVNVKREEDIKESYFARRVKKSGTERG